MPTITGQIVSIGRTWEAPDKKRRATQVYVVEEGIVGAPVDVWLPDTLDSSVCGHRVVIHCQAPTLAYRNNVARVNMQVIDYVLDGQS